MRLGEATRGDFVANHPSRTFAGFAPALLGARSSRATETSLMVAVGPADVGPGSCVEGFAGAHCERCPELSEVFRGDRQDGNCSVRG